MSKLGEFVVYYRKKGLRETLARIRARYFSVLTFVHYQRDLYQEFPGEKPCEDIEIFENNFELLQKERQSRDDLPREFFIDKTHQGKHFYLLYFQGDLAGICWVFKNGDYSRFFKVENGTSCEINYILTLPEFRGKRLSTRFVNHVCAILKNEEFKFVFLSVSLGNVLSHKTVLGSGFKEYMRVRSYFSYVWKVTV